MTEELNSQIDFLKAGMELRRKGTLHSALDRFNISAPNNDGKWVVLFTDKEKRAVQGAIRNDISRADIAVPDDVMESLRKSRSKSPI